MTFRLPAELLDDFKLVAAAENRSVSGALRNLIERRVKEFEAKSKAAA